MSSEDALALARGLTDASVVNAVFDGEVLVFEWIAETNLHDEPWPAPAATVVSLDRDGKELERRTYGAWLKEMK